MIADATDDLRHAWWYMFFPGVALLLTVLAFNLLGDGLQDALNPRPGSDSEMVNPPRQPRKGTPMPRLVKRALAWLLLTALVAAHGRVRLAAATTVGMAAARGRRRGRPRRAAP